MITTKIETNIQDELQVNEKIIWIGQSNLGITFTKAKKGQILISLIVLIFALFWLFVVTLFGAPILFKIFGYLFISLGFYGICIQYLLAMIMDQFKVYVLTNHRLLIKSGLFRKKIKTYALNQLSNLSMKQGSRDTGTIYISSRLKQYASFNSNALDGNIGDIQLLRIDDVSIIYEKLLNTIKGANANQRN